MAYGTERLVLPNVDSPCLHAVVVWGTDHVSIVMAGEEARQAWSCPPSADPSRGACALAAAVSRSGKVFVGSASMPPVPSGDGSGAGGHQDLVVRVASIGGEAHDGPSEVSTTIGASELASSAGGRVALVEAAFLEAREPGLGCSLGDAALGACFRVLAVAEDDSAIMVGAEGLEWVREEALAAVDQVRLSGRRFLRARALGALNPFGARIGLVIVAKIPEGGSARQGKGKRS